MRMNYKRVLPHLLAIAVFLITIVVLFLPHFQGKVLQQGDIVQYRGASREVTDHYKETGERTNWTNAMFGGMPTYQITAVRDGNQLTLANRVFYGFMSGPAGYVFCGMLTFYLLLVLLGVSPWVAAAGGVMSALATNNIVLYEAGHVSKVGVIMYLPLVAAGVLLAFRNRYLLGGAVFALGMGLAILANHPQMLYYFGLTLPFLGVAEFTRHLRAGTLPSFARSVGVLLIGLALALGAGASNLLTTSEYLPQTIRGGAILNAPASAMGSAGVTDETESNSETGLSWDYAMQWSNGFKDMLATYAPMAAGGGSGQEVSNTSSFGRAMTRGGFRVPATFPAPLYHGSLPFTEGPIYLGAVVFALFVFGLFTASTRLRIWLGGGTLLIFVLSLGKTAESFNRLLFDILPLFNNFRTPNSALSVVPFLMILLGLMGVYRWAGLLKVDPPRAARLLKLSGLTAAALGALVVVTGYTLDYNSARDAAQIARFTGGQGDVNVLVEALVATRGEVYFQDAMRSLLFVGLTYGILFLLWKGKLALAYAGLLLGLVGTVDFIGINQRYLSHDDFQPQRVVKNVIQPTEADRQILQDPDPYYRVLNLSSAIDQNAFTSYFHNSIGGYSAAKLRRYEDLIKGYLEPRNQEVLNMLNTKYFLVPGEEGAMSARRNPDAYGNAWTVERIERVAGADEAFRALGETEALRTTAIIEETYASAVEGLTPDGQGRVELTDYAPSALAYRFTAPTEQLVVFSEIWYGPDLGWEALIDGEPAELIRANYALRALRVPAGEHTIEMRFAPATFALGRTISLVCSVLILLAVIAALLYPMYRGRGVYVEAEVPKAPGV